MSYHMAMIPATVAALMLLVTLNSYNRRNRVKQSRIQSYDAEPPGRVAISNSREQVNMSLSPSSYEESSGIKANESIFFVETDSNRTQISSLTFCALESVSRHNPERDVYLVLPGDHSILGIPEFVGRIPRLKVISFDFRKLARGTPMINIWKKVERSRYKLPHLSDVVRLLLLFKFGGYYLDTDLIILDRLPSNMSFLVMQALQVVNQAVMHFPRHHDFVKKAMEILETSFNGNIWTFNGPGLMRRTCKALCYTPLSSLSKIDKHPLHCFQDVYLLGPNMAYPIPHSYLSHIYSPHCRDQVLNSVSTAFAVHLWHSHCHDCFETWTLPGTAAHELALRNCPNTLRHMNAI